MSNSDFCLIYRYHGLPPMRSGGNRTHLKVTSRHLIRWCHPAPYSAIEKRFYERDFHRLVKATVIRIPQSLVFDNPQNAIFSKFYNSRYYRTIALWERLWYYMDTKGGEPHERTCKSRKTRCKNDTG